MIACDRQGRGTNLLAFDTASVPDFCFGTDSCARHVRGARKAGIAAEVLECPGIALDVDEPLDLKFVMDQLSSIHDSHTGMLLHETELGLRVGATLASILVAPSKMRTEG